MSENTGNKPVGAIVPVVTILAIVGIIMFISYDWVSGMSREVNVPTGPGQQQMVEERIRPVGRVAIAGRGGDAEERVAAASDVPATGNGAADTSPGDEADGDAASDADVAQGGEADGEAAGEAAGDDSDAEAGDSEEIDGEAVYRTACTVCHGAGIAGAPKTGDAAAWEARLEQGMETLVKHAIDGFQGDAGVMPPRGGHSNLSDEEVQAAVQYMVDTL